MVPVRCEQRGWDYGRANEEYPCWIFAEHLESSTAFAYAEHGFGPSSPWGLLFIKGEHMSIGMDSGWFDSLEDLFRESKGMGRNQSSWPLSRLMQPNNAFKGRRRASRTSGCTGQPLHNRRLFRACR